RLTGGKSLDLSESSRLRLCIKGTGLVVGALQRALAHISNISFSCPDANAHRGIAGGSVRECVRVRWPLSRAKRVGIHCWLSVFEFEVDLDNSQLNFL